MVGLRTSCRNHPRVIVPGGRGGLCDDCIEEKRRAYTDGGWRKRSAATITAHREKFGNVCPGWRIDRHVSTDLVVDHDVGVLCRSCNGRKAATDDKVKHAAASEGPAIG